MLVKGYQLIGISCTTANEKKLCKSKGFEIILRARQIGGDEGKAILICCAKKHDRETLEKEGFGDRLWRGASPFEAGAPKFRRRMGGRRTHVGKV